MDRDSGPDAVFVTVGSWSARSQSLVGRNEYDRDSPAVKIASKKLEFQWFQVLLLKQKQMLTRL